MNRRLKRSWLAGVLAVGILLAGGAIAYASIPDSSGVIHGCYQMNVGNLRVIDTATDTCRPSEVPLAWSQTGPQGPQGQPGPQGPQGNQGPQGPSGISHGSTSSFNTEEEQETPPLPAGNFLISATAVVDFTPCPLCIGPPHSDCHLFDTQKLLALDYGELEGADNHIIVPFTSSLTTTVAGDQLLLRCDFVDDAISGQGGTINVVQVDNLN
jgi:hypothetical protein